MKAVERNSAYHRPLSSLQLRMMRSHHPLAGSSQGSTRMFQWLIFVTWNVVAISTPVLPSILDTDPGGSSSSSTVLLHTAAGGLLGNIFSGIASNGGFSLDTDATVFEAIAVNTSAVNANDGTVRAALLSEGTSQHDFRSMSCLNATHCAVGTSGLYVPVAKGGVFLSTDGGATWKFSFTCVGAGSDSMMSLAVNYHSESVISVNGKSAICYTKNGGASWSTFDIYEPGYSTYSSGEFSRSELMADG